MPVFIHLSIMVVDKKVIKKKYKGGISAFKNNYYWGEDTNNQEDDELFAVASMNSDDQDIEELISNGLSFDMESQRSDDFTIVNRYGGALWPVPWLEHDYSFAWHVDADENFIEKAKAVDKMTMEKIADLFEDGINLFSTIRSW
ncbi:MAG: hypothetical protein IPL55_07145 [Saprospiraceae bacterium]|nr:hypothetical protein [Saprospiraceae bacterium]